MSLCREMMPPWEIKAEMDRLTAENERLRAALHYYADFHENPNDGPWGMQSDDFGNVARAALEGRTCTCHPSEAPTPCQQKYALGECIKAALEGRT